MVDFSPLKNMKQVKWNVWINSSLLTVASVDFFRDTYLKKVDFHLIWRYK